MKILLLLVLKCFIYSKITVDCIHQSGIRDVSLAQVEAEENSIDGISNQGCFRIKRELATHNDLPIFEQGNLNRSPRRKRAVIEKKNKVFFRRRKKKLQRKGKIRKSLLKRGKFTTATPYRHMKKYARGKGKLVRPPGLKYRKGYRFNTFKKTQDVALGIGAGGSASAKKSPPKKRPPIHVRDYERARATRKAARGRAGERKARGERDPKNEGPRGKRKKGGRFSTPGRTEPKGDYYDEGSDFGNDVGEDSYSLPEQTKAPKQRTFGRITKTYPWGNVTKQKKSAKTIKKDSESDYSSEDNTLLLSDEEQLTDISSEIEALRSDISDERPKHRKNASSSEYEQYSYAEDDSAIVQGDVASSKDESIRVSWPPKSPKTTLLGKTDLGQFNIDKLEAAMERTYKKKKSKAHSKESSDSEYDDPFMDLDAGYRDETSYESIPTTKSSKQKGQKSKTKLEKSKPKAKKTQPKTKLEKKSDKSESITESEVSELYDETEYYEEDSEPKYGPQSGTDTEKDGEESDSKLGTDIEYYSDDYESDPDARTDDSQDRTDDNAETYTDEEIYDTVEGTDADKEKSDENHNDGNEFDPFYTRLETSTPLRRIPTWKRTQSSNVKQETLYEEYTDTDDDKKPKQSTKSKKLPKTSQKIPSPSSKKGRETSTYESDEYKSEEFFELSDTDELKKGTLKLVKTSKKDTKTPIKTVPPKPKHPSQKNHETSTYDSDEYETEEYSESDLSHSDKKKQIKIFSKPIITSKNDPKAKTSVTKIKSKVKPASEKSPVTSDYESEYTADEHTDSDYESDLQKSGSKSKNVVPSEKKTIEEKDSTFQSDDYYSDESQNKKIHQQTSKSKQDKKSKKVTIRKTATKNRESERGHETSMNESTEDSDYSSDQYSDNDGDLKNFEKNDLEATSSRKPKHETSPDITKSKKVIKTSPLEKMTSEKDTVTKSRVSNKIIQREKHLPNQITSGKPSPKTTIMEKHVIEKHIEKSHEAEESVYHSRITSYEDSSEEMNHLDESFPKRVSFSDEGIKKTTNKNDEMSYDESEQFNSITDHANDYPESEESEGSSYDETKPMTASQSQTTSKTKRVKKGFTTLPATEFNSDEALKKISSKAAAITKKHLFIYDTKKKAYGVVRADLLQSTNPKISQLIVGQPTNQSRSTVNSLSTRLHSEIKNPSPTASLHLTENTLKKRVIRRKNQQS